MIDCSTSHEEEKVQNYRGKKRLIFNRDLMFAKVVKQKKTFYLSSSACMLGFAESSLIRCETVSRLMIGIHLSSSWFPTNFACENEEVANVKQFSWPWALFLAPVVVRVSRIFQTMLQLVTNWSLINVYKKHFFLIYWNSYYCGLITGSAQAGQFSLFQNFPVPWSWVESKNGVNIHWSIRNSESNIMTAVGSEKIDSP